MRRSLSNSDCRVRGESNWSLGDIIDSEEEETLPLESFNHVSREVLNIERSKKFYCSILGFKVLFLSLLGCD